MENNNLPSEEIKVEEKKTVNEPRKADTKIYKMLSYIGILWIIGLVVQDVKDDPEVKFHVGQGMLITIVCAVLNTVIAIVAGIGRGVLFSLDFYVLLTLFNVFIGLLMGAINLATLGLMIFGIINANNNEQKELPVIGKYAFYK